MVNVDNFARAETARMLDGQAAIFGRGTNEWLHHREPIDVGNQSVIRMNRDTLYSSVLLDISEGATLTMPDAGGRYMATMVVNEDHLINAVYDEPGAHELTIEDHETPFVAAIARTFIDPDDGDDIAEANALQDSMSVTSRSTRPYTHPEYDQASLDATREALLRLSEGVRDGDRTFGSRAEVDPVRHLIGTAAGWGALPERAAYYYLETEARPAGRYTFRLTDVPVNGFWSVTIYNRDGYMEPNPYDSYSLNSVTAIGDDAGVTLNLAPEPDGLANHLYVMDGWNYALRLYGPRPSVLDKTWTPPQPQRA